MFGIVAGGWINRLIVFQLTVRRIVAIGFPTSSGDAVGFAFASDGLEFGGVVAELGDDLLCRAVHALDYFGSGLGDLVAEVGELGFELGFLLELVIERGDERLNRGDFVVVFERGVTLNLCQSGEVLFEFRQLVRR